MTKAHGRTGPGRPEIGKMRGFRCSNELWEAVEKAAAHQNQPIAEWMRQAVIETLKNQGHRNPPEQ